MSNNISCDPKHIEIMYMCTQLAKYNMSNNGGGPFGAAIVKDNKVICIECNHVVENNDPTAHAEISAIRHACKILNTYDLSGCVLYATGSPCPMCMGAALWANIDEIVISGTLAQADNLGFKDFDMYDDICYLKDLELDPPTTSVDRSKQPFKVIKLSPDIAGELYRSYKAQGGKIY